MNCGSRTGRPFQLSNEFRLYCLYKNIVFSFSLIELEEKFVSQQKTKSLSFTSILYLMDKSPNNVKR